MIGIQNITPSFRIVNGHYNINCPLDSTLVTSYQNNTTRIPRIISELVQNAMDWVILKVYQNSIAEGKTYTSTGLEAFTDVEKGLIPNRLSVTINNMFRHNRIEIKDKVTGEYLLSIGLSNTRVPNSRQALFIKQFGTGMIDAIRLLGISNSSKRSLSEQVVQAGGHGIGFKQLAAVMVKYGDQLIVTGSIPDSATSSVLEPMRSTDKNNLVLIKGTVVKDNNRINVLEHAIHFNEAIDDASFLWKHVLNSHIVFRMGTRSLFECAHLPLSIYSPRLEYFTGKNSGIILNSQLLGGTDNSIHYLNGIALPFAQQNSSATTDQQQCSSLVVTDDIREFTSFERDELATRPPAFDWMERYLENLDENSRDCQTLISKLIASPEAPFSKLIFAKDLPRFRSFLFERYQSKIKKLYNPRDLEKYGSLLKKFGVALPPKEAIQSETTKWTPLEIWLRTPFYDEDNYSMPESYSQHFDASIMELIQQSFAKQQRQDHQLLEDVVIENRVCAHFRDIWLQVQKIFHANREAFAEFTDDGGRGFREFQLYWWNFCTLDELYNLDFSQTWIDKACDYKDTTLIAVANNAKVVGAKGKRKEMDRKYQFFVTEEGCQKVYENSLADLERTWYVAPNLDTLQREIQFAVQHCIGTQGVHNITALEMITLLVMNCLKEKRRKLSTEEINLIKNRIEIRSSRSNFNVLMRGH